MTTTTPHGPDTPTRIDALDELLWRGLLHTCTDPEGLRDHLATPGRLAYVGYDPTADSLTIGNLVTIMMLRHWQRAGHRPVIVMGGGTGLIGDPSGKSAERQLRTKEEVSANVQRQRRIFESVLDFSAEPTRPIIVNNLDWLGPLGYLDMLRDVGKFFRVNEMVKRDSVRDRLDREQGISYTEFSYMILQAYDFARLYGDHGVTVQMGGSDQFGNIVSGCELIRQRAAAAGSPAPAVFGLTCPLITKSDGGKFGKTESGAIWCTPDRTSPYAMHQFWLNTADADVERFLKVFTLLSRADIQGLMAEHQAAPEQRLAQRRLADEVTQMLHGPAAARQAEEAGRALFSGELARLDEPTLREVFGEVPSSVHPLADLDGQGADPVGLLTASGLAKSNREAREFIAAGSISLNGRRLGTGERITRADLLHGSMIALRRGRKQWHLTRWS